MLPLTLAQNPLADAPPPPPLPAPPALEAALLEGWALPAGLLVAGVVLGLAILPRLGRPRLGLGLAGVALPLALAAGVTSWLVVTDREHLRAQTDRLVAGIARADPIPAGELFAADVRLTLLGEPASLTRDQLLERIAADMSGRYALRDRRASTSRLLASVDGPNVARTQARIRAVHDATSFPASTWWIFHWRKVPQPAAQPWQLVNLELQQLDGFPAGTRVRP
jgi:hypothetical protein